MARSKLSWGVSKDKVSREASSSSITVTEAVRTLALCFMYKGIEEKDLESLLLLKTFISFRVTRKDNQNIIFFFG